MSEKLQEFQEYLQKMDYYEHVTSLLYWDMETNTPKNGFEGHANAMTYFSTEAFKLATSPQLGDMLDALTAPDEYEKLDDMWKFVVKRMKRDFDRDRKVPADFYEKYVAEKSKSGNAWKEAKKASDFSIFAPHLEKMISMTRQICEYTNPGEDTYDVLLDQFEEGMDSETIDSLFNDLKKELKPLIQQVLAAKQPDASAFEGKYNVEAQKKVQMMLLDYIGFSKDSGTVGETEHPFTMGFSSNDVRVTNHYYEDDALPAMYSAIHEGGHAIFEQNANPAYNGTVAADCSNMGLHESQSRFYENILGRNKNFWVPIYEKLGELLPAFCKISLEDFYHEINHVRNSMIRTEADELTYCFHIIIRYEIEKDVFRDNIAVSELPSLWNQKMQEYLQITPANDAEGILQDMHWSDGSFGYFPSYLLGSIYDGMFLDAIEAELGSVDEILKTGRIHEITKWLNEKIHWYGNTRTPKEVIAAVCGKEVSAEPLVRYFKKKYTKIYNL